MHHFCFKFTYILEICMKFSYLSRNIGMKLCISEWFLLGTPQLLY